MMDWWWMLGAASAGCTVGIFLSSLLHVASEKTDRMSSKGMLRYVIRKMRGKYPENGHISVTEAEWEEIIEVLTEVIDE